MAAQHIVERTQRVLWTNRFRKCAMQKVHFRPEASDSSRIGRGPALSSFKFRNRIPLRRCRRQAHISVGSDALILKNDLQPAHLVIAEATMIGIVKKQNTEPMGLEHILLRPMKIGPATRVEQ